MLASFVAAALAILPAQQDREVARLTKQALERDPVESRSAIEHLAAFGERGVPGLGEVLEKGRVLSRSIALVELRELAGAAVPVLPAVAGLLPASEPAPAEDLLQAMHQQERSALYARSNVSFEKSLSEWSGAAWDERELEQYEPALAADALCEAARTDLAAGLEACLAESKREKRAREGYEGALVAMARAARPKPAKSKGEEEQAEEGAGKEPSEDPPAEDPPSEEPAAPAPPDPLLEALLPYLTHAEALARHLALAALAGAGERAAFARDAVAALLADRDKSVAARAAEALASMGGDGAALGPRLAPLSADSDGWLAVHAARAWCALCPADPAARAALRARLSDRDVRVRATAVMGLARLLAEPEEQDLAAFSAALADRKPAVRLAAARAALVGAARLQSLRPALEQASMKEDDPAILGALTEALRAMR